MDLNNTLLTMPSTSIFHKDQPNRREFDNSPAHIKEDIRKGAECYKKLLTFFTNLAEASQRMEEISKEIEAFYEKRSVAWETEVSLFSRAILNAYFQSIFTDMLDKKSELEQKIEEWKKTQPPPPPPAPVIQEPWPLQISRIKRKRFASPLDVSPQEISSCSYHIALALYLIIHQRPLLDDVMIDAHKLNFFTEEQKNNFFSYVIPEVSKMNERQRLRLFTMTEIRSISRHGHWVVSTLDNWYGRYQTLGNALYQLSQYLEVSQSIGETDYRLRQESLNKANNDEEIQEEIVVVQPLPNRFATKVIEELSVAKFSEKIDAFNGEEYIPKEDGERFHRANAERIEAILYGLFEGRNIENDSGFIWKEMRFSHHEGLDEVDAEIEKKIRSLLQRIRNINEGDVEAIFSIYNAGDEWIKEEIENVDFDFFHLKDENLIIAQELYAISRLVRSRLSL